MGARAAEFSSGLGDIEFVELGLLLDRLTP